MTTERGQPDGAGVEELQSPDRGDLARAAALHDGVAAVEAFGADHGGLRSRGAGLSDVCLTQCHKIAFD